MLTIIVDRLSTWQEAPESAISNQPKQHSSYRKAQTTIRTSQPLDYALGVPFRLLVDIFYAIVRCLLALCEGCLSFYSTILDLLRLVLGVQCKAQPLGGAEFFFQTFFFLCNRFNQIKCQLHLKIILTESVVNDGNPNKSLYINTPLHIKVFST